MATSSAFTSQIGLCCRCCLTEEINSIALGRHHLDAFVRRYIHEHLGYRFTVLPSGAEAYAVEFAIKSGKLEQGLPLLNPGG